MASAWAPGVDGLIVEPDFATFDDVFMALWRQEIPGEGTLWRQVNTKAGGRQLLIRAGGTESTVYVRSAMNIQNVVRIDGLTTIGWAGLDEPARMLCGMTAFEKTLGRLRNRRMNEIGWKHNPTLIVGSPRGFNWLTDAMGLTEDHPPHGYTRGYESDSAGGMKVFIRACKTKDNAEILEEGYEERARAFYGEALAAQEFEASLMSSQGQKYPEWHKPVHVIPHDLALQLWAQRVTRPVGGVDWGHTAPAAVAVCGWTGDREMVVIDEWYHRGKQTHDIGAAMMMFQDTYGKRTGMGSKPVMPWYADPAEPDRISLLKTGFELPLGHPLTKSGQYQSHKRYSLDVHGAKTRGKVLGKNTKQAGIDEIRNLMGIRPGLDHPGHPAGNKLGAPRIYVSERCKNLIWEIPRYRDPPQVEGKPVKEGSDELGEDHACDAIRYAIFSTAVSVDPRGYDSPRKRR